MVHTIVFSTMIKEPNSVLLLNQTRMLNVHFGVDLGNSPFPSNESDREKCDTALSSPKSLHEGSEGVCGSSRGRINGTIPQKNLVMIHQGAPLHDCDSSIEFHAFSPLLPVPFPSERSFQSATAAEDYRRKLPFTSLKMDIPASTMPSEPVGSGHVVVCDTASTLRKQGINEVHKTFSVVVQEEEVSDKRYSGRISERMKRFPSKVSSPGCKPPNVGVMHSRNLPCSRPMPSCFLCSSSCVLQSGTGNRTAVVECASPPMQERLLAHHAGSIEDENNNKEPMEKESENIRCCCRLGDPLSNRRGCHHHLVNDKDVRRSPSSPIQEFSREGSFFVVGPCSSQQLASSRLQACGSAGRRIGPLGSMYHTSSLSLHNGVTTSMGVKGGHPQQPFTSGSTHGRQYADGIQSSGMNTITLSNLDFSASLRHSPRSVPSSVVQTHTTINTDRQESLCMPFVHCAHCGQPPSATSFAAVGSGPLNDAEEEVLHATVTTTSNQSMKVAIRTMNGSPTDDESPLREYNAVPECSDPEEVNASCLSSRPPDHVDSHRLAFHEEVKQLSADVAGSPIDLPVFHEAVIGSGSQGTEGDNERTVRSEKVFPNGVAEKQGTANMEGGRKNLTPSGMGIPGSPAQGNYSRDSACCPHCGGTVTLNYSTVFASANSHIESFRFPDEEIHRHLFSPEITSASVVLGESAMENDMFRMEPTAAFRRTPNISSTPHASPTQRVNLRFLHTVDTPDFSYTMSQDAGSPHFSSPFFYVKEDTTEDNTGNGRESSSSARQRGEEILRRMETCEGIEADTLRNNTRPTNVLRSAYPKRCSFSNPCCGAWAHPLPFGSTTRSPSPHGGCSHGLPVTGGADTIHSGCRRNCLGTNSPNPSSISNGCTVTNNATGTTKLLSPVPASVDDDHGGSVRPLLSASQYYSLLPRFSAYDGVEASHSLVHPKPSSTVVTPHHHPCGSSLYSSHPASLTRPINLRPGAHEDVVSGGLATSSAHHIRTSSLCRDHGSHPMAVLPGRHSSSKPLCVHHRLRTPHYSCSRNGGEEMGKCRAEDMSVKNSGHNSQINGTSAINERRDSDGAPHEDPSSRLTITTTPPNSDRSQSSSDHESPLHPFFSYNAIKRKTRVPSSPLLFDSDNRMRSNGEVEGQAVLDSSDKACYNSMLNEPAVRGLLLGSTASGEDSYAASYTGGGKSTSTTDHFGSLQHENGK